jgi:hypothetical protein
MVNSPTGYGGRSRQVPMKNVMIKKAPTTIAAKRIHSHLSFTASATDKYTTR